MNDRWWEMTIDSGKLDWIWDGRLDDRGYGRTEKEILARILSRPCPTCKADPGQWCRIVGTGTPIEDMDRQHVSRRAPWRREHGLDL